MDVFLSKKPALKRRASLSLLFGSQKPTFAALNDKPTRYYDFVDAPLPHKPPSLLIDRQDISPELESKIKYACSLLVYRIEQGVPSPPMNEVHRRTTQTIPANPQLDAKYPILKSGSQPSMQVGYDSGIGLTQQPSIQTMRVLNSRSSDPSESRNTRVASVFSNTRTGTSCSNTSVINSTALSCTDSSTQSPKQNELQSMTGDNVLGHAPQQNFDTQAFLTESSAPAAEQNTHDANANKAEDAIEVFLDPNTTNFSTSTLSTHPSPSLGLSRVPANGQNQNQQSKSRDSLSQEHIYPVGLGTSISTLTPTAMEQNPKPNTSHTSHGGSRSIIIDSTGRARLLTPDEECMRNKALQQAVLEKMTPDLIKYTYNPMSGPSAREHNGSKSRSMSNSKTLSDGIQDNDEIRNKTPRFGFSWISKVTAAACKSKQLKENMRRRRVPEEEGEKGSSHQETGSEKSMFRRLGRFAPRGRDESSSAFLSGSGGEGL
ncbi:uncharacterized protein BJX67DRAFT_382579 [Aspergillus lucknowensis]|uniref:Uncharacterized protein n=1 Tax=Aspergillus lucknowensis TaxID=176173 RepID=A0ABR4LM37_9EURO